jgi:2-polyprenyl-6-methoxyphenol hydroxylase-like FAD-dependent oxidoreductase
VASLVGARPEREGRHAAAFLYGHWAGLELASHHWYFRPGLTAGAIPTNDSRTCVFVGMPRSRFAEELPRGASALFDRALAEADPGLARTLPGVRREAKLWPFAGTPGFARRAWGPGWALVGDAGMFRDPITAHGITDALRDAELLARAVLDGTDGALAGYQRARDDAGLRILELSDEIASFAWDLDHVKVLHEELTKQTAREVELVRALGVAPRGAKRPVTEEACR